MPAVCLFNKYGHCRFRETCRKLHYKELCENPVCETVKCEKRHPKSCKYFNIFNRCKFGSFCSFAHKASPRVCNNEEIEAKFFSIDKRVEKLENEIKQVNLELTNISERNESLESKLKSTMESFKVMCEITVKKATDAIVEMITKQQDASEKKQKESFDTLNELLVTIISKSQPSQSVSCQPHVTPENQPSSKSLHQPSSQPCLQPASQAKFQCDICGKTFGSSRTLTNHTRKDHEPKPS